MDKRKNMYVRWMLASVLAVWIAGQLIVGTVRYFYDRDARQQAETWFSQAHQDANSNMTKEDAIRWLWQHGGTKVAVGRTMISNGEESEWHAVIGSRKLNEGSFWTHPATAELEFHFDADWHFQDIRQEVRRW